MKCNGCQNDKAIRVRVTSEYECCDRCGGLKSVCLPDVYFSRPYLDPNLGNPKNPHEVNGIWIESKRHKQKILNEQGLVEKGDRKHGARNFNKSVAAKEIRRFKTKY